MYKKSLTLSLIISIYTMFKHIYTPHEAENKGEERKILYNLFCCRLSLVVIMLLEFLYLHFQEQTSSFTSHPFHLTFTELDGAMKVMVYARKRMVRYE